ncbi:putative gustatory receptor 59e [Rhagoletis pomonella]|uniref:putative gustatory receptor 59e n=1 Tax=Rhagoletis pomonella TaxID=28610 RepID=UPI00178256DF|nr:putative gustatory receptor 59e [Rhagoletis pomonella]
MRTHPDFVHWLLSLSIFHLPNILITLNLGQYWLALRFLCRLYRGFNQILKQRLQKISSSDLSGGVETNAGDTCASEFFWYPREFYNTHHPGGINDECKLLKAIRGSYGDLDALRAQLTSLFGLVLLLIFLGSLLSLTVECFAVYKFLDCEDAAANELATVYQRLLNILIHIGRIFLILVTNNAIIEEKCQTSFTLNELHITSEEMEHEVNRFLIQLMVHQPAEMVCGIVDLDLLALGGIGGIMANYVIFLIQIDLGNINMDENNQNITAIPGDRFSL